MNIEVIRYSFFKDGLGNNLRYTEHSPTCVEEDHQLCNCTKNVKDRPAGTPLSVTQDVILHEVYGDRNFELSLTDLRATFRWEGDKEKDHAYFWYRNNEKKNLLNVEISVQGCGSVDCFFAHMFFGNDVDISDLMNGHAPSRIIDLKAIRSDQIWKGMHHLLRRPLPVVVM